MKDIKTIGIYAYIDKDLNIIGGLEAQVYHLSKELEKRDYQIIIHCLADKSDDEHIEYKSIKKSGTPMHIC